MPIAADPILLEAGRWLGAASGGLALLMAIAFLARWGIRFRLVGITSFTTLLALSSLAFAVSYAPRISVPGAVTAPVVYDNGGALVIAAAPVDLTPEAYGPTVEQVARNLRGSGRTSDGGLVHVRLRRLETAGEGVSRPVVLAQADENLSTGEVTVQVLARGGGSGRSRN